MFADQVLHGLDLRERLVAIDAADLLTHRLGETERIAGGADGQTHAVIQRPTRRLRNWLIDHQPRFAVEDELLDVADDSDDGEPGLIGVELFEPEALAERVAIRPEAPRQTLADDRDRRGRL